LGRTQLTLKSWNGSYMTLKDAFALPFLEITVASLGAIKKAIYSTNLIGKSK
jgi:hypothetical protein